jgi:hypothetical protein
MSALDLPMKDGGLFPTTLGMNWDADPSTLSEHARFIRTVDWESSGIGSASQWPQQLHQAVDFLLADYTPAAVMWGDNLTVRHPRNPV